MVDFPKTIRNYTFATHKFHDLEFGPSQGPQTITSLSQYSELPSLVNL